MVKLFNFGSGILIVFMALLCPSDILAQNTITSGNWSDPTVWSGGAVPAAGGTVNVNNPLTIDTNIDPTGTWTFNSNATDQPGGTAYTFDPNDATNVVTISAGVTVTFEGGTSGTPNAFNSGTINIFGTLILGYTEFENSANLHVNVESGGTLIINGNLVIKDNVGTFVVDGALVINGNFDNQTGSVTVGGSGSIDATGSITSNGGSTVFGTTNDCTVGPCSGTTLTCTFTNTVSPTTKTICNNTTAGTLTGTTNATSPTYQWLSSTDGVTYSNASGTSTNATYVTPALTQTTWYKLQVTSNTPCTSKSAATKVTVLPLAGGWVGGTSNDWSVGANWCSGVPTSSTDVIISNATGISNMPSILAGVSAVCKNLTINNTTPASSVTIAASGTASLSISGNFTNNGTFTDNSTASTAGVLLVGSAAQTIAGSTANVFNNLTIANTSGATPAINITTNNVTVRSNLTMTAGNINLNGYTITNGTSAGSTGTLVYGAGKFYGGNITRWIPTSSIAVGSAAGQFPIGTSTDYRPIYFGNAGLTAGGTIKVSHTGVTGATNYGASFADNGGTVVLHSNSFWTVSTGTGIGTGTHNLRTEGTGFGTVGAVTDLRQTLLGGIAPGSDGAHAGTTANPQVNRTGLTTANLSNNFYWGSINAVNTTLPIKLSTFSGAPALDGVELRWTTLSEENFDHFVIERSDEGDAFYPITSVKGHGTTANVSNYSYLDVEAAGRNYYRLKIVDFDGGYDYSQVIVVDAGGVVLFPNPVTDHKLAIKLDSSSPGSLMMVDCTGKVLMIQNFSELYLQIVLPESVPSGIYFMKLQQGSSQKAFRVAVMSKN